MEIGEVTFMYMILGLIMSSALFLFFGLGNVMRMLNEKFRGYGRIFIIDKDKRISFHSKQIAHKRSVTIGGGRYLLDGLKTLLWQRTPTYFYRADFPPPALHDAGEAIDKINTDHELYRQEVYQKEQKEIAPIDYNRNEPLVVCRAEELENICLLENMSQGLFSFLKKYRTIVLIVGGMAIGILANVVISWQMHNDLTQSGILKMALPFIPVLKWGKK